MADIHQEYGLLVESATLQAIYVVVTKRALLHCHGSTISILSDQVAEIWTKLMFISSVLFGILSNLDVEARDTDEKTITILANDTQ